MGGKKCCCAAVLPSPRRAARRPAARAVSSPQLKTRPEVASQRLRQAQHRPSARSSAAGHSGSLESKAKKWGREGPPRRPAPRLPPYKMGPPVPHRRMCSDAAGWQGKLPAATLLGCHVLCPGRGRRSRGGQVCRKEGGCGGGAWGQLPPSAAATAPAPVLHPCCMAPQSAACSIARSCAAGCAAAGGAGGLPACSPSVRGEGGGRGGSSPDPARASEQAAGAALPTAPAGGNPGGCARGATPPPRPQDSFLL